MKSKVTGINSLVLVLVAFSSLLSMFALTRLDNIVHGDLYGYGLHFSYGWAMPYWTMTTLIFTLGWFNIIIACAFQFYVLKYGQRKAEAIPQREALKPETTYHPPTAERPVEPEPHEMKPAETRETIAPPMEVELGMREETREAVEEIPPQEYIETESRPQEESEGSWPIETVEAEPEEPFEETGEVPSAYEKVQEVEGQGEQEAEHTETVEAEPKPEERYEEPQEPVDVQFQEEAAYVEEEETVETETQDTPPPTPEIEAEATEGEETQTETLVSAEEY